MTLQDALIEGTKQLNKSEIEVPSLDAEILLCHVADIEKEHLYAYPEEHLDKEQKNQYETVIARRAKHEPLAYITNEKAFYGMDFYVDNRVLIPRPETENLIEEIIAYVKDDTYTIADIGSGSGCISCVLKKHLPQCTLIAVDKSKDALNVTQANVVMHKLEKDIILKESDLLTNVAEDINIIVANLPYIDDELKNLLQATSTKELSFEPKEALYGGHDGLDYYDELLKQSQKRDITAFFFEIGCMQKEGITKLQEKHLPDYTTEIKQDLAGLDRIAIITKK